MHERIGSLLASLRARPGYSAAATVNRENKGGLLLSLKGKAELRQDLRDDAAGARRGTWALAL
jgi:hypothetical protein